MEEKRVEYDNRSFTILTNKNDENIDKIIWQGRRLSIRAIAKTLNIHWKNVCRVLTKNLIMKTLRNKIVPKSFGWKTQ